jgi:L-threonylcarbamoyladenylate synthase
MSAEVVSIASDGGEAARKALEACVSSGGVAVFPADGVYGLCCDPIDENAILRIHQIKGRDEGKSSAVLYFSPLAMRELLAGLTPRVGDAVGELLPGPLTLILPNPEGRYPLACREDPERLGVRLLDGPLEGMPLPVFQTSANLSGSPPPSEFSGVDQSILREVDLAIDGGALHGDASTVLDLTEYETDGRWHVLRQGAIALEGLVEVLRKSA